MNTETERENYMNSNVRFSKIALAATAAVIAGGSVLAGPVRAQSLPPSLDQIMEAESSTAEKDAGIADFIARTEHRPVEQVLAKIDFDYETGSVLRSLVDDQRYGGSWYNAQENKTYVSVTSPSFNPFSGMGLDKNRFRIVESASSLRDLVGAAQRLASMRIAGVHGIEVRQETNSVVLRASSPLEDVARVGAMVPGIPITVSVSLAPKPATLGGGEHQTGGCTSGFAFSPNLVSTASHCGWRVSQDRYTGGTEPISNYAEYCYAETQLSDAPGGSVGEVRANVIKGSNTAQSGHYVYHYGKHNRLAVWLRWQLGVLYDAFWR